MIIKNIYLAFRKKIRLFISGRYFIVQKKGVNYLLDAYAYIDRNIEAYGIYEPDQLTYFIEKITNFNPSLFIDAGANLGLYSVNVAREIPGIRVIAFEPDARNRAQLIANLFLNELVEVVSVEGVALSDRSGFARFHRHNKENPGRSMLSDEGTYTVTIKTLDDKINSVGERIAIKIDVEGHELPLLKGAYRVLTENECFIQVESFAPAGVFEFLSGLDYFLLKQYGNDYFFTRRQPNQRSDR